jgi:hypothetical protein
MNTNYLPLAQGGFIILSLVYFTLLILEFRKAAALSSFSDEKKKSINRTILVTLVGWTILISVFSFTDIMSDFSRFPFNVMPVMVIPLVALIIVTFFSKTTAELLNHIPQERLIRLQSFRFFVEILLWLLFLAHEVPIQMTFEGRNLDILSGITAPVIAWLASRGKLSRTTLIVWNIACLGLLVNIVGVAILSMPVFHVFNNEPANTIVAHFPISWLPGLLVPLAYTLHFLSLRKLLKK